MYSDEVQLTDEVMGWSRLVRVSGGDNPESPRDWRDFMDTPYSQLEKSMGDLVHLQVLIQSLSSDFVGSPLSNSLSQGMVGGEIRYVIETLGRLCDTLGYNNPVDLGLDVDSKFSYDEMFHSKIERSLFGNIREDHVRKRYGMEKIFS